MNNKEITHQINKSNEVKSGFFNRVMIREIQKRVKNAEFIMPNYRGSIIISCCLVIINGVEYSNFKDLKWLFS